MALGSAHLGCTWILGGGGALPSRIYYAVVVPGWALACPRKYGVCIVLVELITNTCMPANHSVIKSARSASLLYVHHAHLCFSIDIISSAEERNQ